jgi:hypothetical protein
MQGSSDRFIFISQRRKNAEAVSSQRNGPWQIPREYAGPKRDALREFFVPGEHFFGSFIIIQNRMPLQVPVGWKSDKYFGPDSILPTTPCQLRPVV